MMTKILSFKLNGGMWHPNDIVKVRVVLQLNNLDMKVDEFYVSTNFDSLPVLNKKENPRLIQYIETFIGKDKLQFTLSDLIGAETNIDPKWLFEDETQRYDSDYQLLRERHQ